MSTAQLAEHIHAGVAIPDAELEPVLRCFHPFSFAKGEHTIRAGAVETHVYFVLSGVLRGYFHQAGQEYTTAFTYDGHWCCSFASFLSGRPSVYSIEAISASELLGISKTDLHRCFDASPAFERFFRRALEQLVVGMEFRERELMCATAEERFNRFMGQSAHLLQVVPQKIIAAYLNMTPETFSRLRRLQRDVS